MHFERVLTKNEIHLYTFCLSTACSLTPCVQQKETEELGTMIEQVRELNIQVEHLIETSKSEYQLAWIIGIMCFRTSLAFLTLAGDLVK